MYSQNNEEEIILQHLGHLKTGRFLDIGAYDGQTFSNTLALAERGWSGVCIEPSPANFIRLMALHKERPTIELVNAAVVYGPGGMMRFHDSGGDGVSTLINAHREKWEKGSQVRFQSYWLLPLPIHVLFQTVGYNFQFVNLDVEGHSADLFLRLPLNALGSVACYCVEHDNRIQEIENAGATFGFHTVAVNAENVILVKG
jgi:FkbM family methyltransferase